MTPEHLAAFVRRIEAGWSLETSSRWEPANPARGQCSVTTLVAQDILGGEILKTQTPAGTHFYNRIDGERHDFTLSQFDRPIAFDDVPASRDEVMADTSPEQYRTLLGRVRFRKRPSARLLVLDHQERVLLFRFRFDTGPLAGTAYWATPGGGLDEGESFAEAARRELAEETGIDADVGEAIAVRHTRFSLSTGEMVDAEEHYFLVRTDGEIDISRNPDPVERAFISEAKWWARDEIAASAEAIFPENIFAMIAGEAPR